MIALLTPTVLRHESPHGQGVITYEESNQRRTEQISGQTSSDPIRQSDTVSRPARMPIVLMSLRPKDWNSGFPDAFLPYARVLTQRLMPSPAQANARMMNQLGIRPNITRPPAAAYGSLFTLGGPTYDIIGGI